MRFLALNELNLTSPTVPAGAAIELLEAVVGSGDAWKPPLGEFFCIVTPIELRLAGSTSTFQVPASAVALTVGTRSLPSVMGGLTSIHPGSDVDHLRCT